MTKPILHHIHAKLYRNHLTDDPNDYTARVDSAGSRDVRQICQAAISRGGADVSEDALEHYTRIFLKEMAYQLSNGHSVNTDYFHASPKIRGTFHNPNESFDPDKHQLYFHFQQGSQMHKTIENTSVEIDGLAAASTRISRVVDVYTQSINDQITPNHNLRISGTKLKIVGDDPRNGITLIHTTTDQRFEIEDHDIIVNNPKELIIFTPNLPAGSYQLEVTTQYTTTSRLLKTPNIAVFEKVLKVL
ncbi:MAG: DUF4469 domain-containing protein [Opitutales bacterium]|nr:DUF4469 domain-containing protein [Opitutales bacterium]